MPLLAMLKPLGLPAAAIEALAGAIYAEVARQTNAALAGQNTLVKVVGQGTDACSVQVAPAGEGATNGVDTPITPAYLMGKIDAQPAVIAGGAIGTGGSATWGNGTVVDSIGSLVIATGSNPTSGVVAHVTYSSAFETPPVVVPSKPNVPQIVPWVPGTPAAGTPQVALGTGGAPDAHYLSGTDRGATIQFTTGHAGTAAGKLFSVTFGQPLPAAPHVVPGWTGTNAPPFPLSIDNVTTTGFDVYSTGVLTIDTTYKFTFYVEANLTVNPPAQLDIANADASGFDVVALGALPPSTTLDFLWHAIPAPLGPQVNDTAHRTRTMPGVYAITGQKA